jgi:hypothetical protein
MNTMQIPAPYTSTKTFGALDAQLFDANDQPASIVKSNESVDVEVSWYLESPIPPVADWKVQVAYQQVGGSDSGIVSAALKDFTTGGTTNTFHPLRKDYLERVSFPPAGLSMGTDTQRAYELTVILTAQTKGATPTNLGFAAYYDLGIVQVITP